MNAPHVRGRSIITMTPLESYQQDLAEEGFEHDPRQAAVVHVLQKIYEELTTSQKDPWGLFRHLRFSSRSRLEPVVGLYLWGSVGRGKTHLVNQFYRSLPFVEKLRLHFHLFM